jgi:type III secretory pathway lipoprotein EscJ
MKRVIQVILFIVVVILVYMCVTSILRGISGKKPNETPVIELFENKTGMEKDQSGVQKGAVFVQALKKQIIYV